MKSFRFSLLSIFCIIAAFILNACTREDVQDYREQDYGYVQFKLYKEASYPGTRANQLDYLSQVAKIKVTL